MLMCKSGQIGTSICCRQQGWLVHSYGKLTKPEIIINAHTIWPISSPLGIYPLDILTQLHLALFEVASNNNNNKLWYIHSVEYYTTHKKRIRRFFTY